jgi:hypothetical protein
MGLTTEQKIEQLERRILNEETKKYNNEATIEASIACGDPPSSRKNIHRMIDLSDKSIVRWNEMLDELKDELESEEG